MNEQIFEKIKGFVERQRWKYKFPLERTTKVEEELKITGADAVEFLVAFGKEFNVDVSSFMAEDYFHPEGYSLLSLGSSGKKKVLTLGDLEKGAIAGRLDEKVLVS